MPLYAQAIADSGVAKKMKYEVTDGSHKCWIPPTQSPPCSCSLEGSCNSSGQCNGRWQLCNGAVWLTDASLTSRYNGVQQPLLSLEGLVGEQGPSLRPSL